MTLHDLEEIENQSAQKISDPRKKVKEESDVQFNIFSVFSVLLSLSIILTVYYSNTVYTTIVLGIILLIASISNEIVKVKTLFKYFKLKFEIDADNSDQKKRNSFSKTKRFVWAPIFLSLILALAGVWLWITNRDFKENPKEELELTIKETKAYYAQFDSDYLKDSLQNVYEQRYKQLEEYKEEKRALDEERNAREQNYSYRIKRNWRTDDVKESLELVKERLDIINPKIEEVTTFLNERKDQAIKDMKNAEKERIAEIKQEFTQAQEEKQQDGLFVNSIFLIVTFFVEAGVIFMVYYQEKKAFDFRQDWKLYQDKILELPEVKQRKRYLKLLRKIYAVKSEGDKLSKSLLKKLNVQEKSAPILSDFELSAFVKLLEDQLQILTTETTHSKYLTMTKDRAIDTLNNHFMILINEQVI